MSVFLPEAERSLFQGKKNQIDNFIPQFYLFIYLFISFLNFKHMAFFPTILMVPEEAEV